ncbi:hypothetical protein QBC39DRAFT_75490 [Podospora conica]|nr:hypothetical protein QBC39DRAFT_75490 [Schizothecium conicum]
MPLAGAVGKDTATNSVARTGPPRCEPARPRSRPRPPPADSIPEDGVQCDKLGLSFASSLLKCIFSISPSLVMALLGTVHLIPGEPRGQQTGPKPTMGFPAELCTRCGLQPQTKSRGADAMEPGNPEISLAAARASASSSAGPDPPRSNAFTPPLTQTCLLQSISVGSQNNHPWSLLQHDAELAIHRPMSPLDRFWQPMNTDVDAGCEDATP